MIDTRSAPSVRTILIDQFYTSDQGSGATAISTDCLVFRKDSSKEAKRISCVGHCIKSEASTPTAVPSAGGSIHR